MQEIAAVNLSLLLAALLVLAGILSSLIATRFGAPLLVIFLVIGMMAGEDGPGGIVFNDYRLTYLVGSLALAIILFDGGMRTRFAVFRSTIAPAGLLATAGVLITAAITGATASLLLGLSWIEGLLIGSIVASTDAAAVFFLMRAGGLQLRRRVSAALEIESGTNDPFAVFLTIILVNLIAVTPQASFAEVFRLFAEQIAVGTVVGGIGGFSLVYMLNRLALPSGLHPLFAISVALAVYGVATVLEGSGFLAVYLGGIILGNRPARAFPSILSFHDAATWLCQILMFLVLGLLVTPSKLLSFLVPALIIAAVLIVVARPVAVWLCLTPFQFSVREKAFISWVGLRGAVSIFLAAIPTLANVPRSEVYFNVAFVVVFVSLLVQGWTLTAVARGLKVALSESAPETQRIEIDLPGQTSLEIVGYPIVADSLILTRKQLPSWIKPLLVARASQVLGWEEARSLEQGDYAYFLVPTERSHRLDRLFALSDAIHTHHPVESFNFAGDTPLSTIETLYGLAVPEEIKGLTVAQAFARTAEDRVGIGDRIHLGPAALAVLELDGDQVKSAALEIDDFELPNGIASELPSQSKIRSPIHSMVARIAERVRGRDI